MSPQEARRLFGHVDKIEQEQDLHRRQRRVGWSILAFVAIALLVGMCAASASKAAEPDRQWTVVDASTGRPVVSPKGYTATATNQTACQLATVEAVRWVPSGTRLACKRSRP